MSPKAMKRAGLAKQNWSRTDRGQPQELNNESALNRLGLELCYSTTTHPVGTS